MSLLSIILVTISAIVHAGWNLFYKRSNTGVAFIFVANTLGAVFFLPYLLFSPILSDIPYQVWLMLLLAGFFLALYMGNLALAYNTGELSVVYPTIRSMTVVLVTLLLFVFWNQPFSNYYFLGSALIVIGLYIVNLRPKNSKWYSLNGSLTTSRKYTLLAIIGATGYSLLDGRSIGILKELETYSLVSGPLTYLILLGSMASFWMTLFIAYNRTGREIIRGTINNSLISALIVGIGMYTGYMLTLASMAYANNVGYVLAFRQVSIPIGTFFSFTILKEKIDTARLMGTILILAGLVLVGLG